MNKLLGKYKNGNYNVAIYEDGTKIRYNDLDELIPNTVESMDIKITNKCDMRCEMCLMPSAKLNIKNLNEGENKVEIKSVKAGDLILSYNHQTNSAEYCKILNKFERDYKGDLIEITLSDNQKFYCTPNHPIYTARGYVKAEELDTQDLIFSL